jgi:crotonobetainyl-CoA:carnitine CoA-transferase CaiB-like acyl-CoA transferase
MTAPEGARLGFDRGEARLPLEGIKVLDLSNLMAGPSTTMHLADFGAEVIKVERPGRGDDLRRWGHMQDGVGLAFKVLNRNKRLITLDLSTAPGQEVAKRLVERVDIVVESFRPGTLERWGLGFDDMLSINPSLIMGRITGFGQQGPYSHRRAFGTLGEAMSGIAHMNSDKEGQPRLPAFGLGDASAAIFAAYGLVLALFNQRMYGGKGQFVDLALYEGLYTFLGLRFTDYAQVGATIERGRDSSVAPRNTYRCLDGTWLALSGGTQGTFSAICQAAGRPELPQDPRFSNNEQRVQHVDALDAELAEAIGSLTWEELEKKAEKFGAPMFPIYDIPRFLSDPQVMFRGNAITIADQELGSVLVASPTPRLSNTPGNVVELAGPPGKDNVHVYRDWLDMTIEEYGDLSRDGVI